MFGAISILVHLHCNNSGSTGNYILSFVFKVQNQSKDITKIDMQNMHLAIINCFCYPIQVAWMLQLQQYCDAVAVIQSQLSW